MTFEELLIDYFGSNHIKEKAQSTQDIYLKCAKRLLAFSDTEITELRRVDFLEIRDQMGHTPAMANITTSFMSCLMSYALDRGYIFTNEFVRIPKLKTGTHARWPDYDIQKIHAFEPRVRIGGLIAYYTGQRQCDVLNLKWRDVQGGEIQIIQQKTGKQVWIPLHRDLKKALKTCRELLNGKEDGYIVGTQKGTKMSLVYFRSLWSEECKRHNVEGLKFHGLRKSAASHLAEAGCNVYEIMAITGHQTVRMVEQYTKEVDQKRLARSAITKSERA